MTARRPGLLALGLLVLLLAACARVAPEPPRDLPPPSTERPPPPAGLPPAAPVPTQPPERAARPEGDDAACPGTGCPGPSLPSDVRALWVVRTSLVHPDSARAVVRRAHDAGFNTLLVQLRGRGDAWYPSALEPRPVQQAGLEVDPLRALLDEARARGLAVHGWVNVGLVASAHTLPTDPLHPVHRFPEALAVPRELAPDLVRMDPRDPVYLATLAQWARQNEDRVEGVYQSPVDPRLRRHLVSMVTDLVVRYPLDGLHLDYLRYPAPDFDHSRQALEAFREVLRDRAAAGDPDVSPSLLARAEAGWPAEPSALPEAFPGAWAQFLAGQLEALLVEIHRAVRWERPDLLLSAAVFADGDDARRGRYQPWDDWLRAGLLDVVVPMAYTTDEARWARQVEAAVGIAGGDRVWAGIGIWQTTLASSVARATGARSGNPSGPAGLALFSYDWAVGPEGEAEAGGNWLLQFGGEVWGVSPR